MSLPRDPLPSRMTWDEFLGEIHRRIGLETRVCMPARVLEYVPPSGPPRFAPPRVRCMIELRFARKGMPTDEPESPSMSYQAGSNPAQPGEWVGDYPELLLPVHFPGPWGMWSRGPLVKGEQGKIIFCDRSLDTWQMEADGSNTVDPAFSHTHGFPNLPHDAWFEPGVRSGPGMQATPPGGLYGASVIPEDGWSVGMADRSAGVEILRPEAGGLEARKITLRTTGARAVVDAQTEILVGANAIEFAAVAKYTQDVLQKLVDVLTGWTPVAQDGGLALKTALTAAFIPQANALIPLIAALKAKVE